MKLHANARTTPHSRLVMVRRLEKEGWTAEEVAESFGVSARTVYRWLRRWREGGIAALVDRASRPLTSPRKTSDRVEARILEVRRRRKTARQIAATLDLAHSTVGAVLRRHGLQRLKLLDPVEPIVRYEKEEAGELLHLDTKKLGRIKGIGHRITGNKQDTTRGVGWDFAHVCIDDATRLAYVEVLPDEKGATCAAFVERAVAWFARHGVRAQRLLTDNGSGYVSHRFREVVVAAGLRHSFTRPYRPQTNGKAERFIQTLTRGWAYGRPYTSSRSRTRALASWLDNYNHHRQHAGIGYLTPFQKLGRAG
ncbi:MAG: IS481 family transposase [Planctomycetes bacterium]|nr:IS481 family transposase [Planctomycetota bacterium]